MDQKLFWPQEVPILSDELLAEIAVAGRASGVSFRQPPQARPEQGRGWSKGLGLELATWPSSTGISIGQPGCTKPVRAGRRGLLKKLERSGREMKPWRINLLRAVQEPAPGRAGNRNGLIQKRKTLCCIHATPRHAPERHHDFGPSLSPVPRGGAVVKCLKSQMRLLAWNEKWGGPLLTRVRGLHVCDGPVRMISNPSVH
jgi:hypothetical protein